eukprot:6178428-Pleurochrysis_carterae.AAC.2
MQARPRRKKNVQPHTSYGQLVIRYKPAAKPSTPCVETVAFASKTASKRASERDSWVYAECWRMPENCACKNAAWQSSSKVLTLRLSGTPATLASEGIQIPCPTE